MSSMNAVDVDTTTINTIKPFEWLTSSESIIPIIESLDIPEKRAALHVGCGSSTLGEALITSDKLQFQLVANIDKDEETLERMKERWLSSKINMETTPQEKTTNRMQFRCMDWCCVGDDDDCNHPLFDNQEFNLVLDKSTLDCTLCSDRSTAGLIKLIHDHLAIGGFYVVISFHDAKQLLMPMLQDCPGTKWKVSHQVITRQVEDLIRSSTKKNCSTPSSSPVVVPSSHDNDTNNNATTSTSRTVNVLICQKYEKGDKLTLDAVQRHVHETNDTWFRSINPLLSNDREQHLQQAFSSGRNTVDLPDCYKILFTDLERENLPYDFFLQDWEAYCSTRPHMMSSNKTCMTLETALDFLQEMQ